MYIRNWVGLFLLGTINNLPYVIVTSAASTIATSFGKKNLIGLVFGANVALSAIVKSVNGAFLLKVPYGVRFAANAVLMLIGLFGVAYAPSFWFSLVCIVFVGASAAFGEKYAFLLTSPAVGLYLVSYFFIIKCPSMMPLTGVQTEVAEKEAILDVNTSAQGEQEFPCVAVKESSLHRIWRCTRFVGWMALNLSAVYLFEYIAQGCAAKVRPKSEYNIGCPELYAGLSLCYQAGVFVSRSSVQLFTVTKVHILSVLQFINMMLWIVDVHFKFLPVHILPALMIYVGLLGGASYVNIFYILLHDDKYNIDRELCINIAALFITFGIIGGTALETLLFSTALKYD
ncbi:battenin-like isoform X4 [Ruditapes philippinarum]|uniref:battenin-like isoform X4 n=1 Tax=Ruditapes philippinarum TaxID=129788 RepID=UPI00295B5E14|nr:battenin-like isoform X4 [Ruditapes philippinarum]